MARPRLTDQLRARLRELIRINLECCKCLCEAAAALDDEHGGAWACCNRLASQRQRFAEELSKVMAGPSPRDDARIAVAYGRGEDDEEDAEVSVYPAGRPWRETRRLLDRGEAAAAVDALARGEEFIASAYHRALEAATGSSVRPLLVRQLRVIEAEQSRVRELRQATNN